MIPLPVANILHHKLRSGLSALGVGIGVCMLITLSGLSRGSLQEVADRWDAVHADLIVYPARWGDNITTVSGGGLSDADAEAMRRLTVAGRPAVERVVPVFLYRLRIAGQEHNVVGVAPGDLPVLLGGGGIQPGGRAFDPDNAFATWLAGRLTGSGEDVVDIPPEDLARRGGLEMVIDGRLARAAGVGAGGKLYAAGHDFAVVGVVPQGALARAFMPLATAQFLFNGRLGRHTLLFVKLASGVAPGAAAQAVRHTGRLAAIPVNEYRGMLESRFGIMYRYVDAVNGVVLIVAFLFVLVTLYTMVLQRTREIAILRSMGATRRFILRQVLWESLLLTACGTAGGVLLSLPAGRAIEMLDPFLTVRIGWGAVLVAVAVAAGGGVAACLYPAWCAMRVDMVDALSFE